MAKEQEKEKEILEPTINEPVSEMTEQDVLEKLLNVDTVPTKTVLLKRIGVPVTLKGLTNKRVSNIKKECTEIVKRRGKQSKEINEEDFEASLIAASTVKPDWGNPQLMEKYNASRPIEVIKKILLAGEMSLLSDMVLELSGFDDELEVIDTVKKL